MGNPDTMCGNCYDQLIQEEGEQPEFLACGHGFHAYCLGEWMKARNWATIDEAQCPMCRQSSSEIVTANGDDAAPGSAASLVIGVCKQRVSIFAPPP